MTNGFDNEMDTLLRRVAKSESSAGGIGHLDADEISAFAENALPEKARNRCVGHLADCDPCRQNLAMLIALNAEAEPVPVRAEETVAAVTAPPVPWYSKLFSFPTLAYGLGALVLVFTGITAFTLLQNSDFNSSPADVAQMENTASSGDPFEKAAATAPTPELTDNSEAAPAGPVAESPLIAANRSAPGSGPSGETLNGADLKDEVDRQDGATLAKSRDNQPGALGIGRSAGARRETDNDAVARRKLPAEPAAAPPVVAGQTEPKPDANRITTERSATIEEESAADKEERKNASEREVNGKTFRRSNNVWYDSAYANQPTTNIRRGTTPYQNLDRGLRLIAEELEGTVVVVWKAKAYKIF